MGLDAVVFIHIDNLASNIDKSLTAREVSTGEVYFRNVEDVTPEAVFRAVHKRLGNISTIGYYRQQVGRVLGKKGSVLLDQVLYSGSHCGDCIELKDLDRLEQELARVEQAVGAKKDIDLTDLIASLRELIAHARQQKNPIVFT